MTANKTHKFKFGLGWQILTALILGIIVGAILHDNENKEWLIMNVLSPAGKIFIQLIKMIVVPIVISTLVVGIAGVGNTKQLGKLGFKTILYFEIITTIAIIVGISLANIFQPGVGIDMSTLSQVDISQYEKTTQQVESQSHGIMATILSLVPSNIFAAMSSGEMLPVIFFAVIFGMGLSSLPVEKREPLLIVLQTFSETMFRVTHMIMMYAPIGVFGLISVTVANFGFTSLIPLIKLVLLVHGAILFFAIVVLGLVAKYCGINIFTLI
ncbi:cation:dicarboxylase symporter family transporter, partial [Proteus mirabilis]|nr:cation:dicarboxylase symporter family transporter [Proteus mirabilis]